jgi:hypothetical protein
MPGGDHTGPLGAGPRTGRGMGYCGGYDRPGFADPTPGFRGGFGFRRGGIGRGRRHRSYAGSVQSWTPPTPEQETADLKAQADW